MSDDFRTTRDSIAQKTRELLAIRIDADGRRIDDTAPPADDVAQVADDAAPTGPRAPAPDPTQGSRADNVPAAQSKADLINAARRRAGFA